MKTIEELRALHAATTQTDWTLCPAGTDECGEEHPFDYVRITKNRVALTEGISANEACHNAAFIATAHNEFPAMLDEIERLRNEVVERGKHTLALETALCNLLCVINDDKDGGFFICEEARDRIEDAQKLLG